MLSFLATPSNETLRIKIKYRMGDGNRLMIKPYQPWVETRLNRLVWINLAGQLIRHMVETKSLVEVLAAELVVNG
jgi:hypothetical protein